MKLNLFWFASSPAGNVMPSGKPPNSIIVGNCIACQGLVRVPATINAQSNVRCPHCQETFAVNVLLDLSVPELEIVDSEQDAEAGKPALYINQQVGDVKDESGKFVVPSQLAKGARRRGKSRRSRSHSSRDRGNQRNSDPKHRVSSRRSASDSTRPTANQSDNVQVQINERDSAEYRSSSRRPTVHASERNPAVEFLKVIAGAALAIPIAYLVVMWGFGQDPLGFGRPIGNLAPFLVPEKFQSEQVNSGNNDDENTLSAPDLSQPFPDDSASDLSNIGQDALDGLTD